MLTVFHYPTISRISRRAVMLMLCGCGVAAAAPVGEKLSFNSHVQPLLSEYCYHCHGPDSGTRMPKEAPLRLDREDFAFLPRANGKSVILRGDAAASELMRRLQSPREGERMPPPASHKILKPEEIATIARWINEGAKYEPHWSLVPPQRPDVPAVPTTAPAEWRHNPVDAFLLDKMQAAGLAPNPPDDKARLLRRVSFDLTGLPPSPEELQNFLADTAPDAYEKAVDRLLASPRYGEHMARYWLDAARYADTHGIHIDNFRSIWPYRDWVIAAFNTNMPFDQFTIEQIGGDLLPAPTLDQTIATGFNRCLATTGEGGAIEEEVLANYAKDRVETTSGVWLGLTMGCAACHDHKFDPIPTRDFYSFAAFFRNTPMTGLDGNKADHPPNVFVPSTADRDRFTAIAGEIKGVEAAMAERAVAANNDFEQWLQTVSVATLEPVAENPQVHLPLVVEDNKVAGLVAGQSREWSTTTTVDGLAGLAPVFKDGTDLIVGDAVDVARGDGFSYGAYIRVEGNPSGAVVAKMDPAAGFRGWDMWLENGKVGAHVIDTWPNAADKILSKRKLEAGKWYHVMVVFDGKKDARQAMALYIDGKLEPVDMLFTSLGGNLHNTAQVRLGRREPRGGDDGHIRGGSVAVQDLRIYHQTLSPASVMAIADYMEVRSALAVVAANRTPAQNKALRAYYLVHADSPSIALATKLIGLQAEEAAIRSRGVVSLVMQEHSGKNPVARILERGDYTKPGEEVAAAVPTALPPLAADQPVNRLGLARWLVDPRNPLTARVTVNRMWQQVFGLGIVETTEDFGIMGARPSHPELLDYLAVGFVADGWNIKNFMRTLVTTAAYRQSGQHAADKNEKDPRNTLLARGPRNRLDAEPLRDMALFAAGLLVEKTGGPSVKPYQPENVWETVAMKESNTRIYKQDSGDALYRRSLYTFWKRTAPLPSMETLNAPSREVFCTRRERTNTPLQALVLLNDPQFVEASRCLAEHTLKTKAATRDRFDLLAMRLLARPLAGDEAAMLDASLAEFTRIYKTSPDAAANLVAIGATPAAYPDVPELATWTLVASQILNMDECVTH